MRSGRIACNISFHLLCLFGCAPVARQDRRSEIRLASTSTPIPIRCTGPKVRPADPGARPRPCTRVLAISRQWYWGAPKGEHHPSWLQLIQCYRIEAVGDSVASSVPHRI